MGKKIQRIVQTTKICVIKIINKLIQHINKKSYYLRYTKKKNMYNIINLNNFIISISFKTIIYYIFILYILDSIIDINLNLHIEGQTEC